MGHEVGISLGGQTKDALYKPKISSRKLKEMDNPETATCKQSLIM
jgi:hypothetical protein